MDGYRKLPWEQIETVIGVVIFDPQNLPSNVFAGTGTENAKYKPTQATAYVIDTNDNNYDILEWASQPGNGIVMFFNRFTGADTSR